MAEHGPQTTMIYFATGALGTFQGASWQSTRSSSPQIPCRVEIPGNLATHIGQDVARQQGSSPQMRLWGWGSRQPRDAHRAGRCPAAGSKSTDTRVGLRFPATSRCTSGRTLPGSKVQVRWEFSIYCFTKYMIILQLSPQLSLHLHGFYHVFQRSILWPNVDTSTVPPVVSGQQSFPV